MKFESTPNCRTGEWIAIKYKDWLAGKCIAGIPLDAIEPTHE